MELLGLAISVTVLLGLLCLGIPVAFCVLAASVTSFVVFLPPAQMEVMGSVLTGSLTSSSLAAVPLFLLMGELFARSGLSNSAYRGMARVFERLPGGMLHTNVAACSVFAAASGSSVGTTAAIGKIALPQLHARDYPRELSYGSLLAGGTLGILIPPSLALIIFGILTGTSIADLFAAGVIPGILLAGFFIATIMIMAKLRYRDRMPAEDRVSIRQAARNLLGVVPLLSVIVAVLASLYFGIATPTEAGAVGAAAMLLLAAPTALRNPRYVRACLLSTVSLTGMVLTILASSALLSYVVTVGGFARRLEEAVGRFDGASAALSVLVLAVVMLVMGMFLDPTSIVALILPVVYPVSQALEIDPLWLAVFMVVNVELGLLTPPIGLNLFVLRAVDPTSSWGQLLRGALPFMVAMVAFLVMLWVFPGIATWLPAQLDG